MRGDAGAVLDEMETDKRGYPANAPQRRADDLATSGAAEICASMHGRTAGGIMTRGYVALHKDMTVDEAITFLRATRPLAEEAYYLFVLDGQYHLQGIVSLRGLIVADGMRHVEEVRSPTSCQ
jgi:magnesium transporter